MTKQTKWLYAQRRLISAWTVWSESSLSAQWVAKDPSFLQADSEDSDQTGRMPRLIWVFAGRTLILLVLSCRGSYGRPATLNRLRFLYTKEQEEQAWIETRHEKTCLRGFRPGKTQTGLFSYKDQLESWKFGFSKYVLYYLSSEQQRCWSDCAENRLSHDVAQLVSLIYMYMALLPWKQTVIIWGCVRVFCLRNMGPFMFFVYGIYLSLFVCLWHMKILFSAYTIFRSR